MPNPAMHCAHCGRRIKAPAAWTEAGPVGPVCAVRLGLRSFAAKLGVDGLPRARAVRQARPVVVDESQLTLELL